jgi:hypothetical protein
MQASVEELQATDDLEMSWDEMEEAEERAEEEIGMPCVQ